MKGNAQALKWLAPDSWSLIQLRPIGKSASELQWRATRDGRDFFVFLDLTGNGRHHCTCAQDAWRGRRWGVLRRGEGLFCRHVVAAAMRSGRQALLMPLLAVD